MTRSPDLPANDRFRLPAGTVVYHGSRLELADVVRARGLRSWKPAGPYGNWRSSPDVAVRHQPAGIYVVTGALEEVVPWADVAAAAAGSDGTPCVWKIDASGLTATADLAYSTPNLLRLVGRRIRPERLIGLYDVTRQEWIA
jgi:hypothetical protein